MNTSMTRRGFISRATGAVAVAVAAPAAPLATAEALSTGLSTLMLEFCEGVDMEHREILGHGANEAALRAVAERHAGTRLAWEEGETEDTISCAMHPHRAAEYLIVVHRVS